MRYFFLMILCVAYGYESNAQPFFEGPDMLQMKGNVTAMKIYYAGGDNPTRKGYVNVTYSNKDHILKEEVYAENEQIASFIVYSMNADKQPLEKVERTPGVRDGVSITYKYNTAGQLAEMSTQHPAHGPVIEKRTFEYDNKSRLLQVTYTHLMGDSTWRSKMIYNYGDKPNEPEITFIKHEDDTVFVQHMVLDEHQNPVSITRKENDNTRHAQYKYTYDEQGNYTKVIFTMDEKPVYTQIREITY